MRIPARWSQAFNDKFTELWCRWRYKSDIERGTVETWSGEWEVYWFSSDSDFRGQATPIGTIILNERKLAEASDRELKHVLEHEISHAGRGPLGRGVYFGLVFWISLGLLYLVKALGFALLIPFGVPFEPVAKLAGISFAMIGFGLAAVRVEEILADFRVLKYVSYDEYLETYEEMRAEERSSLVSKIHLKLVYTSPETIVRLHQMLNRMKGRMFVI